MTPELLQELRDHPLGPEQTKPAEKPDEPTREVEVNGDTMIVTVSDETGKVTEDLATEFITSEGLNPADWEVWRWYKGKYGNTWVDEDTGERMWAMETIKFHYKRVETAVAVESGISEETVERWRVNLLEQPVLERDYTLPDATYAMLIADPQFGKKGTEEAIENYKRGVLEHIARVTNEDTIHLAWMGDETENVVNSYENQPHTIELNRTKQLDLDFDMRVWAIREALATGKKVSASSVISNHGEWTRNGGKEPVTTRSDNASTYIARQAEKFFNELAPFTGQHVEWTIGDQGAPGVVIDLSGVKCYFSHGYIEKGKGGSTELRTKAAIERQILGKTDELGDVLIWFMAHYHHFYSNSFEGRSLFGCPALEAERSSEYMLDQFGVWSRPGLLGMRVSKATPAGWTDLNVF